MKNIKEKIIAGLLIAFAVSYIGSGIAAFGHSAANNLKCKGLRPPEVSMCKTSDALMAAFFSPLYWSWVLFEESPND